MLCKTINSGSIGNGYALICNEEILLIEAGCRLLDVKKAIDFQIGKVVGCLVSHEHGDHAKYIKDYIRAGIEVFTSDETHTAINTITGEWTNSIIKGFPYVIGGFTVQGFELHHDLPCVGFLITHPDLGKLIYASDTEYIKYKFTGLNHILVECNYSKELVDENYQTSLRNRILETHMELNTVVEFVKANDSPELRNVILIHLSDSNSNEKLFVESIKKVTNANVDIALKGKEFELIKTPF